MKYTKVVNKITNPKRVELEQSIEQLVILAGTANTYKQMYLNKIEEEKKNLASFLDLYTIVLTLGGHYLEAESEEEYTEADIQEMLETIKSTVRERRAAATKIAAEDKAIFGFKYKTTGGVFSEAGSIAKLSGSQNRTARIRENKVPHRMMTYQYVGIELEFFCEAGRNDLEQHFIDAGLTSYVKFKEDVSIRPDNTTTQQGHEVNILCRENEVAKVLSNVCTILKDKFNAKVNDSCGVHVHLDMRKRDVDVVYANLFNALPLLNSLIPANRVNTRYCRTNTAPTFTQFMQDTNMEYRRRQAINGEAYTKYKTIEIRMHSGSLNATKLFNWIKVLTTIASKETVLGGQIISVENFVNAYKVTSTKFMNYLMKRVEQLSHGSINDSLTDQADTTNFEMAV